MSHYSEDVLSEMDLWRLSDSLAVPDAAMLVAGFSPRDRWVNADEHVMFERDKDDQKRRKFDAVFTSLRNSILSNRLKAVVKHSMRSHPHSYAGFVGPDEEQVSYDMLISYADYDEETKTLSFDRKTHLNFLPDTLALGLEPDLYVCKEPNWEETLIDVKDLKEWLKSRGVFPTFFFPSGGNKGFMDKEHHRYSPKLACAVAAWEAVTRPAKNKSAKQTLSDWVQSNGVNYGLGTDGVVSPTAADEVAKIANWATGGGANPTSGSEEPEEQGNTQRIENYEYWNTEKPKDDTDLDSEIPF